jgi:hypothetical protein
MPRTLQFRRYNTAQLANTTGANGEIIINTTTHVITVHDGVTPGGHTPTANAVATANAVDSFARTTANSATTLAQSAYNYANTIVSNTQIDPYARATANTSSNNITIIQGVNVTQNTNITNATNLAQSAFDSSNTASNNISIMTGVNGTQNTNISNANNIATAAFAKANTNISSDLTLTVTNSGTGAYVIDGASNPTLTLYRGVTYYFSINASGHPFFIQTVSGAYSAGNVYASGVTGAGTQVGTLTFTVPLDAPSNLYYVCQNHPVMNGAFLISNLISTINTQNSSISILQDVNTTQNTNITNATNLAQSAFDSANTASNNITIMTGVNVTQNTRINSIETINANQNTSISIIQGVDATQNTNITTAINLAQAAFNTANNANTRTVINGLGVSKLDFATYGSNTAYLTTTSDDSTALFMGAAAAELYANTNVSIRANTGGTSKEWTFGQDGTTTFPNNTILNPVDEDLSVVARDSDGVVGSSLELSPGDTLTRLEQWSSQNSESFNTSDWSTGVYTNQGGLGAVQFTGAANIVDFVNSVFGTTGHIFISVNGGPLLLLDGTGGGATDITFYTLTLPAVNPTTVTSFEYFYSYKSGFEIDYDSNKVNIYANDAEINLETTNQRDISLDSSGDVTITANSASTWTFGAEGTLTFPNSSIQNTAFTGTAIDQVARNSANAAAQTIPQNAQSTNYVLQLTDAGKHIYYTQSSNTILHIPTTSNVAFANGSTIMIVSRTSSGANVTVSPNTGVTMFLAGNTTSASRNVTTYGMATLIQVAANTWFINGTGVS